MAEPVVRIDTIEDGPARIRLVAHIPGREPSEVYRDWSEAERVRAWWGPEASIDLRVGGGYEFRWSRLRATLRGRYTRIDRGRNLAFSWAWDEEPDRRSEVALEFRADGAGGTDLEVTQGPYSDDARDQALRQQHLDGWRYHLPKLAGPAGRPTPTEIS
jgi:uncharacterized protein YndB with AHSA1/START domain